MEWFIEAMNLQGGERIIDLGGRVAFWARVPVPLDITLLNLPGSANPELSSTGRHKIQLVEGDACDVADFPDQSFDIAFSNSVIEHVGGPENRRRMSLEVRRLAPRYWVQTPSIHFPIEAHTLLPFWWYYPEPARAYFLRRWARKWPGLARNLAGTTVVSYREVRDLFPEAEIITERIFGIPKSYVAVSAAERLRTDRQHPESRPPPEPTLATLRKGAVSHYASQMRQVGDRQACEGWSSGGDVTTRP